MSGSYFAAHADFERWLLWVLRLEEDQDNPEDAAHHVQA
jgi:hypothetical protein